MIPVKTESMYEGTWLMLAARYGIACAIDVELGENSIISLFLCVRHDNTNYFYQQGEGLDSDTFYCDTATQGDDPKTRKGWLELAKEIYG